MLSNRQRGDPRRRQQGGGGGDPRRWRAGSRREGSPVGRRAALHHLRGAGAARAPRRSTAARCAAEFGFVFDHASPIGELIVAAPTYYRVEAQLPRPGGARRHPPGGRATTRSRPRPPRSPRSTSGGSTTRPPRTSARSRAARAANVVAERCRVELEARSLDHERAAEVASTRWSTRSREAASDCECDVETIVEELFRGYRIARSAPAGARSRRARARGRRASSRATSSTGGGSDANVFQAPRLRRA